MHRIGWGGVSGLMVCVILCGARCATSSRSVGAGDASSPQDKAHQAQLSQMTEEDAESATLRKLRKPKPAHQNRRTGQGVVDQPIRRSRKANRSPAL